MLAPLCCQEHTLEAIGVGGEELLAWVVKGTIGVEEGAILIVDVELMCVLKSNLGTRFIGGRADSRHDREGECELCLGREEEVLDQCCP